MLWEIEIRPRGRDAERDRVCDEFDLLTHSRRGGDLISGSARGFLLEGDLGEAAVRRLQDELLVDRIVEIGLFSKLGEHRVPAFTVLLKPGVMDPVAESVLKAARDLGVPLDVVRTFRRYFGETDINSADRDTLFRKVLANDAIERIVVGPIREDHLALGQPYIFRKIIVPLLGLDDAGLTKLSKDGQLALSLDEMRTIQKHFQSAGRDPSDIELETIAQTWSEHCSHKTLKGIVDYTETIDGQIRTPFVPMNGVLAKLLPRLFEPLLAL